MSRPGTRSVRDPVFREIFEHHTKIQLEIDDIPGGARVMETQGSAGRLLIRQQALEAVSEFVADGMQRAMRPTLLPPATSNKTVADLCWTSRWRVR